MKNIIVFGGSNSKTSINKQLAVYASNLVRNINSRVLDLNDFELPLYGIDLENNKGIPDNAQIFLNHIKDSDGIILSLAEHNGAYTVAFKNLFDWMSRIDGKLWSEKPMLLMAASTGRRGGSSVLDLASGRFPYMGGNIVGKFSLPLFEENFSDGRITNEEFNNQLKEEVKQFEESL